MQRPEPGPSQTVIANNVITDIHAVDGGSGPYGNAISIFRAHNVIVQRNHITDCAFSAVRSNAGNGCQVGGNHCARHGDTVVWIEFGASGAVVMGNYIEDAGGSGVTITNFNRDGRMATCVGNVVINAGEHGIKVEADIIVQGNNIDGAPFGIVAGQGRYLRNIVIEGNLI